MNAYAWIIAVVFVSSQVILAVVVYRLYYWKREAGKSRASAKQWVKSFEYSKAYGRDLAGQRDDLILGIGKIHNERDTAKLPRLIKELLGIYQDQLTAIMVSRLGDSVARGLDDQMINGDSTEGGE